MAGTWSPRIPGGLKDTLRRSESLRGLVNSARARRLAMTSKRLDACAAQFAMNFHLTGAPALEGRACLEIGAGWVLSHALVCHLMGASSVVVTDLNAVAHPSALGRAVGASSIPLIRDILSPFSDHADLRARLSRLAAVRRWDFEVLRGLGIEYRAPTDMTRAWEGDPVDFIYSLSVLEHVALEDIDPMLRHLGAALRPGGVMIHNIHLEDHLSIDSDPLRFLSEPASAFGRSTQNDRGNRVRRSEWERRFEAVEGLAPRVFYAWQRRDKPLPRRIDPSIEHSGEADLRTSHLGVWCVKER